MSIEVERSANGEEVKLYVSENFDFSQHKEFREAYRNEAPDAKYIVNLSNAKYMDSSALGMLLLLRKHAGGDSAQIVIEEIPVDVRKVLEVANFHKIFKLK